MGCDITTTPSGNPKISGIGSATVIAPYDKLQFYANIDTLEDNANFSSWVVHLLHADSFTIAYPNIFTLTKDVVSGTDYRFYVAPWTVPSYLNPGCYRMVIIDSTDGNILYIGNLIEGMTLAEAQEETIFVRYRNRKNMQNFNYQTLTTFYNVHRIRMKLRNPQRQVTSKGYDKVDGSFERVRTEFTKKFNFVKAWDDMEGHDAFETATVHSDFQIWFNNKWNLFIRPGESAYESPFFEDYPQSEGSIELLESAYATTHKAL